MKAPVTFAADMPETIPIHAWDAKDGPGRIKRILVVDDDEMFLDLAATMLNRAGFSVDTAGDGEAGWTALRAGAYDLLITDNDMPRLTGVELVTRAREAGMTLPVVMASGSSALEAIHGSGWLNLAACLRKPFAIHELVEIASRVALSRPTPDPVTESTGPRLSAAIFVPPSNRWGLNE